MIDTYLSPSDYAVVMTTREMEVISKSPELWRKAEATAIDTVKGYLRGRYDLVQTFARRGDERNSELVYIVVCITIWRSIHRLPERMGYDRYKDLYEDAMQWLQDVQSGKTSPDLPLLISADGSAKPPTTIKAGGIRRNVYDY